MPSLRSAQPLLYFAILNTTMALRRLALPWSCITRLSRCLALLDCATAEPHSALPLHYFAHRFRAEPSQYLACLCFAFALRFWLTLDKLKLVGEASPGVIAAFADAR